MALLIHRTVNRLPPAVSLGVRSKLTPIFSGLRKPLVQYRHQSTSNDQDFLSTPEPFKVVFVGAAGLNFGSITGAWGDANQSERFERLLQHRLEVQAIIEPNDSVLHTVIQNKRDPGYRFNKAYDSTLGFSTLDAYLSTNPEKPHIVVFGVPSHERKGFSKHDYPEELIAQQFPGIGLMIEKPVDVKGGVDRLRKVGEVFKEKQVVDSVGFVLRYLKGIQKIKSTLRNAKLPVMATSARFASSYVSDTRPWTWNKSFGTPFMEEGVQLADLSRYLTNHEPRLSTVSAYSLESWEEAGKLALVPEFVNEEEIEERNRVPRGTGAVWKYHSGAIGTLLQTLNLQSPLHYPDSEIEVYSDGYSFKLIDLYNKPALIMRIGDRTDLEGMEYGEDDPYLSEVAAVVDAVEGKGKGREGILCKWQDAVDSYEFSRQIRKVSEEASEEIAR